MKRILAVVFVMIMALTACTSTNTSHKDQSKATSITVGYSLQNLGVSLSGDTDDLILKEGKYSDEIKINGKYTNVSTSSQTQDNQEAYLQGFYKSDLEHSKVYINGKVFSQKDLEKYSLYETSSIVVYDITTLIVGQSADLNLQIIGSSQEKTEKAITETEQTSVGL